MGPDSSYCARCGGCGWLADGPGLPQYDCPECAASPSDNRIDAARATASERLQAAGLRMMLELGMSREEACELMADARRRGHEAGQAARDATSREQS